MKKIDSVLWKMPDLAPANITCQIQDFVITMMKSGHLLTGELIPSHRTFAKLNGLNPSTVKKAYNALHARGFIVTRHGSGTFIAETNSYTSCKYSAKGFTAYHPIKLDPVDFNSLGPSMLVHDFRSIGMDRLSEHYYPSGLYKYLKHHRKRYANITQAEQIRESLEPAYKNAIREYFNVHYHLRVNDDCMAVVLGRYECLKQIFTLLLKPGNFMINTAPADVLLRNVLYPNRVLEYALNSTDDDFITQLEQRLVQTPIRLLYVNSLCNYPDGKYMKQQARVKLVELAKKHKFYILEENEFFEFWYNKKEVVLPLACLDHEGHVIYTGPLSQTSAYMYSTRIIAASKTFITLLNGMPSRPYAMKDTIEELAITDLINSGELFQHVRDVKSVKEKHRDNLYWEIDNYIGKYVQINKPDSGLCFWLVFPPEVDVNTAMGHLNTMDIEVPYNPFIPQVKNKVFHIRLAYATLNIDEAQVAVKIMAKMFEDMGVSKIKKN